MLLNLHRLLCTHKCASRCNDVAPRIAVVQGPVWPAVFSFGLQGVEVVLTTVLKAQLAAEPAACRDGNADRFPATEA